MCNHGLVKPLTDEFRPDFDQLQGYKLISPKEQMMNKSQKQRHSFADSAKMQVLASTLWKRHHDDSKSRQTISKIVNSSDKVSFLNQTG